jgi:hypothetical protein
VIDFLKKLQEGKIYDYSKSPEENAQAGNALERINFAKNKQEVMNDFPDMYVRDPIMHKDDLAAQQAVIAPKENPPIEMEPEVFEAPPEKPKAAPKKEVAAPTQTPKTELAPETSLQDILSKLTQAPQQDDLVDLQNQRRDNLSTLGYIKAADQAAQGMLRKESSPDFLKDQQTMASLPVEDLLQQRKQQAEKQDLDFKKRNQAIGELQADVGLKKSKYDIAKLEEDLNNTKEMNDVSSDVSNFFRSVAKQSGYDVPENVSATQLKGLLPELSQSADRKLKYEALNAQKQLALQERADKQETKAVQDLEKMYDVSKLRTNTAVGKLLENRNNMAKIEAIMDQYRGSGDQANALIVKEAAGAINRVITGSNSLGAFEHFVPRNILMDKAKFADYFTSKLNPAQQGAFMNTVQNLLDREKQLNGALLKKQFDYNSPIIQQYDKKYNGLGTKTLDSVMKRLELEKAGEHSASVEDHSNDIRIDSFMKKNGISDRNEAIQILKENGKL